MTLDVNLVNSCCRVVSQVEYPSLVDLRGLLLDLVAQLLGALSRIRYLIYHWVVLETDPEIENWLMIMMLR